MSDKVREHYEAVKRKQAGIGEDVRPKSIYARS